MELTRDFLDQLSRISPPTITAVTVARDFAKSYESILSAHQLHESICSGVAQKLAFATLDASVRELASQSHLAAAATNTHELLRESLESVNAIHGQLEGICKSVLDRHQGLADIARNFQYPDFSHVLKQTMQLENFLSGVSNPVFHDFFEGLLDLSPRTRKAALTLAAHGWFMDIGMGLSDLWRITDAFSNGDLEEAEEALVEYFEGSISEIEKSLKEKYPHRAHILHAAFNAHRREEFELSVPVFLAQTDGICKETVREYFFMKRNKKPCTAFYVEQITDDPSRAALLSPLTEVLPINASEHERPAGSDILNRHTVLHGESLNYGSRVNSLKAISLINYIGHALIEEPESV